MFFVQGLPQHANRDGKEGALNGHTIIAYGYRISRTPARSDACCRKPALSSDNTHRTAQDLFKLKIEQQVIAVFAAHCYFGQTIKIIEEIRTIDIKGLQNSGALIYS